MNNSFLYEKAVLMAAFLFCKKIPRQNSSVGGYMAKKKILKKVSPKHSPFRLNSVRLKKEP